MTTVISFNKARMQALEDATVVNGELQGDDLVLITNDDTEINVGSVRGPQGVQGDTGPAGAGTPIGMIADFPKLPLPSGWLNCDGSVRNISGEPDLAAYLGTTYGGNGTTTYGLPSYAGRVRVGLDSGQTEFDTVGELGGAKTHTLTTTEMPTHSHGHSLGASHAHTIAHTHTPSGGGNFLDSTSGAPVAGTSGGIGGGQSATTSAPSTSNSGTTAPTITGSISNAGSGGAHNNLQPYRVVYTGIYAGV